MEPHALYDLSPLGQLMALGVALALGPLAWVAWRSRGRTAAAKLRSLTLLILFLTFDLVLFGAFTRLSDSGLGCPDWPGCYGSASPLGARDAIEAAETALPSGAVTHGKAWIEMVHRYLASAVGVMILVLAVSSWLAARRGRQTVSPWWAAATLVWVCLQGAFGALTVTLKLYPAIVTLHLMGGIGLLALLAAQAQSYQRAPLAVPRGLVFWVGLALAVSVVQVALGGWVSTNYAVLACRDFPTCQSSWWPLMEFSAGFSIFRELGKGPDGSYLPFAALTAIHYVHRLGAVVVAAVVAVVAWRLWVVGTPACRRWSGVLMGAIAWQVVSGLSNVVLGWPLVAALAHTGGAAALITLLVVLLTRSLQFDQGRVTTPARRSVVASAAS